METQNTMVIKLAHKFIQAQTEQINQQLTENKQLYYSLIRGLQIQ